MNTHRMAGGYQRAVYPFVAAVAVAVAGTLAVTAAAGADAASASASAAAPGTITTVAGGTGGPGPGTGVAVTPCGLSFADGALYAGTADTVRAIDPATGRITTVAGDASSFPAVYASGAASGDATLPRACGLAADQEGDVAIADYDGGHVLLAAATTGVRYGVAMTAGHVYTVAGSGTAGFTGDGGPALAAELNGPQDVAIDAAGNLLIADSGNNRIRAVAASSGTFYGQAMTAGGIYTIAGGGTRAGNGLAAAKAAVPLPSAVTLDAAGNVLVSASGRLRVIAAKTGVFYGQPMTARHLYTVAGTGGRGFSGDGGPATAARFKDPGPAAVDHAGNLVIPDLGNHRIRVVAAATGMFYGQAMTAGDIYTIAGDGKTAFRGDGGPAGAAGLTVSGAAVDANGNVVISDLGNDRVRVVAASTGDFYGQPMTAGDIYTVAGDGSAAYSGDGGPAAQAELASPYGVTTGPDGTLIADGVNERVRLVAARSGVFFGERMSAGDIYTIAGNGKARGDAETPVGDGGPARKAEFYSPSGVTLDAAGNVLVPDGNVLRVIAAATGVFYGQPMTTGDIYTIAGGGGEFGDGVPATSAGLDPGPVSVDAAGNVVIPEQYPPEIRVVAEHTGISYGQPMTAGDIYTIAGDENQGFSGDGGPATTAELSGAGGAAIDASGNVVVTDSGNNRVRVIAATTGLFYGQAMTAGDIYTIAGNGAAASGGDGGPAISAELNAPAAITLDSRGNVVVSGVQDSDVRVIAAAAGVFYGQAMTAGDIYTIAGDGTAGFTGDGGPGTAAELNWPMGLAADGTGILIADSQNSRIREVAG